MGKMTERLRERIDEQDGKMATLVQAAEALEPIIAEAVEKRPSRLGAVGLKSAHLLANLTAEDERSNDLLAKIGGGSTVGIVFVDVAGFTTYTAKEGDDAAIELLKVLHELVEKHTAAAKGQCVKHLGDGYLLAFPSASQAVRGAVALRDAVRSRRVSDRSFEASLRIAVHAGEPLIEGNDLLGHDVNLTARLLDHCKPDVVVVSEACKELAQRRLRKIKFGKRREVKIRGLALRVPVYSAQAEVT